MSAVTILCGSADESGVTHSMCRHASDFLRGQGHRVSFLPLSEMDIGHCRDCGGCADGNCVLQDDMREIYASFEACDVLILAGPVHFSGPSSLIKTAMDRFQPYWFVPSERPRICAGMLCGGSERPEFGITEKIFRAFCITTGMRYAGTLTIPGTDQGVIGLEEKVEAFLKDII